MPGDLIELGSLRGGMAIVMAATMKAVEAEGKDAWVAGGRGRARRLFIADSFVGAEPQGGDGILPKLITQSVVAMIASIPIARVRWWLAYRISLVLGFPPPDGMSDSTVNLWCRWAAAVL